MGKACWTCKSRKVRCDFKTPTCSNCVKVGKACQYGIQLSWPQAGDARRSIVLHEKQHDTFTSSRRKSGVHFLRVRSSDIQLYLKLVSNAPNSEDYYKVLKWATRNTLRNPKSVPQSMSWIPSGTDGFNSTLVSHYERSIAATLTLLDDEKFKGLLISMSFTDNSLSSVAVRQALYALTAINLYGFETASIFRRKATQALLDSIETPLSARDQLQHIAAGLLLGLFEMYESSGISYNWAVYICSAKQAGNQVFSPDRAYEGDARIILDWLFYHDTLSRFSALHWARSTPGMRECVSDAQVKQAVRLSGDSSKIISSAGCSAAVLEAIAGISELAQPKAHGSGLSSFERLMKIDQLERKLQFVKQYVSVDESSEAFPIENAATKIAELYRLAGLIYLNGACRNHAFVSPRAQCDIEAGFNILADLDTCERAFPLLIIGCEARSDEERLLILDILRRTRESRKIGNFALTQQIIEASWAQDDLDPEKALNYVEKFDAIMNTYGNLPCFA
ncbi:hypothetical protein BT63DRAFT_108716 [Microthyrium microscopicum]|uniref:Zn(2)-C6 fungal-type domain-containing protein n=1 Tax=Microthyrium microscopicum TaxID=703497 RepID=A0A6A6TUZ6_9PEZI|nr:hypothetical protein BT63DRAFT_108716 [Microthyrium microscopicum]